jgi:hypothetical protein
MRKREGPEKHPRAAHSHCGKTSGPPPFRKDGVGSSNKRGKSPLPFATCSKCKYHIPHTMYGHSECSTLFPSSLHGYMCMRVCVSFLPTTSPLPSIVLSYC